MVLKLGCDAVNLEMGGGEEGCTCAGSGLLLALSSTRTGSAQQDVPARGQ